MTWCIPTHGEVNYAILELIMEKNILSPYGFMDSVWNLTALCAG